MKFLHSKAAVIVIAVITVLCVIAAAIAIEISVVMVKKKDQAINPVPIDKVKSVHVSVKPVKLDKLDEQELYFNGVAMEGLKAYSGKEEGVFIPIDTVLQTLGVKYKYFASDDIFEFVMNNRKVVLKINQTEAMVNGQRVEFKYAVQTAKNHVLVPEELLNYLDGFGITNMEESKYVIINYFPSVKKYSDKFKVLKTLNGVAVISDILEDNYYWRSRDETIGDDRVLASYNESEYVIKALNKVFLIKDGQEAKLSSIKVDPGAAWSVDGRYLYWTDKVKGRSYGYNTNTGTITDLGDYFLRIKDYLTDEVSKSLYGDGGRLYDYKWTNRYKRIVLTDRKHSSNYTYIQRRGRTVVEGPALFSPDRKRLLYYENGKGYCTLGADGSRKQLIGAGTAAVWISNNKILLYGTGGKYIVSSEGKEIVKTQAQWKKLGQTPEGDVFYTDGSMLFAETGGKERELLRLVVPCDYIYSNGIEGPYIAVSIEINKVYLINKGTVDEIGDYRQLIKGKAVKTTKLWGNSILTSSEGTKTSILRNVDGLVNVDVLDNIKGDIKTLVLNYKVDDLTVLDNFKMKWIDESCLVVYTNDRGWLIQVNDSINVYNWIEEKDTIVKGILLK